mmetsp:Transcript_33466/g.76472  ORF Transcript_33466/g.76472 Transcript_33466/m.76472 type:complete len:242 (-) Transcript_33466:1769-2494(-)
MSRPKVIFLIWKLPSAYLTMICATMRAPFTAPLTTSRATRAACIALVATSSAKSATYEAFLTSSRAAIATAWAIFSASRTRLIAPLVALHAKLPASHTRSGAVLWQELHPVQPATQARWQQWSQWHAQPQPLLWQRGQPMHTWLAQPLQEQPGTQRRGQSRMVQIFSTFWRSSLTLLVNPVTSRWCSLRRLRKSSTLLFFSLTVLAAATKAWSASSNFLVASSARRCSAAFNTPISWLTMF